MEGECGEKKGGWVIEGGESEGWGYRGEWDRWRVRGMEVEEMEGKGDGGDI